MRHMPGEEAWLVGERRASGERKYYLSSLPPDANLSSPPRSRRDGSASKPTSSSRKNSASITLKADPGMACTATCS